MKNSRNIKTVDLIEALRRCSTPCVHCDGCVFCSDEDHEEPWCGDVLLQEAVRRLEEYTDRCARYAEEIAVLKAAGERVEWIPVTEPPETNGCYLVAGNIRWDGKPVTREAYWNGEDWLSCDGKFYITRRITHWMRSPQPPKGE